MSSAERPRFWKLLAFRLTCWYGGFLAVSVILCFSISYVVVLSSLRLRADADLLREAAQCSESFKTGGPVALKHQMDSVAHAAGINDIFFRVYDTSGNPVATSDLSGWGDTGLPSVTLTGRSDTAPRFENASGTTAHHQTVRVLTTRLDNGDMLQVGIAFFQIGLSTKDDQRAVGTIQRIVGWIMFGMLVVAVVIGWLLARRALAGVQHLKTTANEISRGALGRRVPTSGSGDEVDQLASTFNRMLERIQSLVMGMEQTNDNIAHELRSPITRIRGLAETTLTGSSSLRQYEEMAASTVEDCDRLLAMINTMLDITEAETGVMNLSMAPVDVSALLRDAAELYEPLAAENDIRIDLKIEEAVFTRGDLQRLQRVVANLLDNAIKYTPRSGTITISAGASREKIEIQVANTGEGIAPKDVPNIFKRFYRADASRSGSGNGLGLSLAQAIVHAHGGEITVDSVPGRQTVFGVTLPALKSKIPLSYAKVTD